MRCSVRGERGRNVLNLISAFENDWPKSIESYWQVTNFKDRCVTRHYDYLAYSSQFLVTSAIRSCERHFFLPFKLEVFNCLPHSANNQRKELEYLSSQVSLSTLHKHETVLAFHGTGAKNLLSVLFYGQKPTSIDKVRIRLITYVLGVLLVLGSTWRLT
jgi:hypothetical protein